MLVPCACACTRTLGRSRTSCASSALSSRASRSAKPRGQLARSCSGARSSRGAGSCGCGGAMVPVTADGKALREIEPGRLELGVLVQGVQRFVAPDAGLLEATERDRNVIRIITVDVYGAGAQRARHAMRRRYLTCPYRRYQAVNHVVGDLDGLFYRLECDGRQHGPENLLARDRHARLNRIEHRRLD